jgi:hypothetical protein
MSISKKTPEQLAELKNTLKQYPHILEVHFTDTGGHFFNKHELLNNGKKTGKFYGFLRTEMVVAKIVGERKFFKSQSIPTPEAEIVETLDRDEVISYGEEKKKAGRPKAETVDA